MSHDVEGEAEKLVHIEHAQVPPTEDHIEEEDDQEQLLDMEELVPITQTLITPTLARLFNLNSHQLLLRQGIRPAERSHPHYEELQQMQLQEDDPSKGEEDDSKLSADDPCLQIMIGSQVGAAADCKQPHINAGLDGYGAQLGDDGADDHAEGFGMNHLLERENSSNSGDGTGSGGGGGGSARTLKRPRLVWTPQLHKRFVDAVSHLGITNAVPKTIMQLMNVEGLTRENVASHLQKYRLYLRRVKQGNLFSSCGAGSPNKSILGGIDHHHQLIGMPLSPAASSDHLFSSSSLPSNSNMASNSHHSHHPHPHSHHHQPPGHMNHLVSPNRHMQSLLLQQPQHQRNPAMAMVKSPAFTNQHLNPQRFSSNAANSGSPALRPSWSSPHASILDINSLHHVESHGTTAAPSSPPRRALTLFPH